MKEIIGFWHIGRVGDWQALIAEQFPRLEKSGLIEASKHIIVGFVGGAGHLDELPEAIRTNAKFKIFTTRDREDFEFPTLERAHFTATMTPYPFYAWYVHTKSASSEGTTSQNGACKWRYYMEHYIIDNWKICVEKLELGADTVGVEWRDHPWPHYSGNFWWATSEHLKKLPNMSSYWKGTTDCRMDAESYIGQSRPHGYCLANTGRNLYYGIEEAEYPCLS